MKRNRQKLLWLFGLPLFIVVLAHWGFHFFVKSQLDELIWKAQPGLDIRYSEVSTNLLGRVEIDGLQLRDGGRLQPLLIDRLVLQGPNLFSYLLRNNPVSGVGLPKFLELLASGMEMKIRESRRPAGDGCDLQGGIPPRTLQRLGFELLEGEASARYRYQPEFHVLEASLDSQIDSIQNLRLKVRLQNVTPEGFKRGQLGTAALSEATLVFDVHPTFGKRLVEYCAARRQLTPLAFEGVLVRTMLAELERAGVIPGPDLETALARYVRNWGTLEVNLLPPVPMNLVFIPFVPTEQLHSKLGFEMYINGKPVRGLRFGKVQVAREDETRRRARQSRRFRLFRKQWLYEQVAPETLSRYIGHRVRLKEQGDPVRSGLLVDVSRGHATVQQWIDGGKFMAHLSLAELVRAEVLVLKELEVGASTAQQAAPEEAEADEPERTAGEGEEAGGQ